MNLKTYSAVTITGQAVTLERSGDSPTGWCATGWQQGLPVARKPISEAEILALLERFPHTLHA